MRKESKPRATRAEINEMAKTFACQMAEFGEEVAKIRLMLQSIKQATPVTRATLIGADAMLKRTQRKAEEAAMGAKEARKARTAREVAMTGQEIELW